MEIRGHLRSGPVHVGRGLPLEDVSATECPRYRVCVASERMRFVPTRENSV